MHKWLRRGLLVFGVAGPLLILVGLGTAKSGAAPFDASLRFGKIESIAPSALTSISCWSPGDCSAIGVTDTIPFHIDETDYRWEKPVEFAGAISSDLESLSCISMGNCSAVGSLGSDPESLGVQHQPVVVSEVGGVWGPLIKIGSLGSGNLSSVSCTSGGDCVAVGFKPISLSNSQPIYSVEEKGSWGPVVPLSPAGSGALSGVSCTSLGNCTSVGATGDSFKPRPVFAVESKGKWSQVQNVHSSGSTELGGVSCTSAGDCVAAGSTLLSSSISRPVIVVRKHGRWGAVVTIQSPIGWVALGGVSCPAQGDCISVGYAGDTYSAGAYVIEANGKWGTIQTLSAPKLHALLINVSCAKPLKCTSVGWTFSSSPFIQHGVVTVLGH